MRYFRACSIGLTPQHLLLRCWFWLGLLLFVGCSRPAASEDELPDYARAVLDETIPITNAWNVWVMAIDPWFAEAAVDLDAIDRAQADLDEALSEAQAKIKALPMPENEDAKLFRRDVLDYCDFLAEKHRKLKQLTQTVRRETPPSLDAVTQLAKSILEFHNKDDDHWKKIKASALRLDMEIR